MVLLQGAGRAQGAASPAGSTNQRPTAGLHKPLKGGAAQLAVGGSVLASVMPQPAVSACCLMAAMRARMADLTSSVSAAGMLAGLASTTSCLNCRQGSTGGASGAAATSVARGLEARVCDQARRTKTLAAATLAAHVLPVPPPAHHELGIGHAAHTQRLGLGVAAARVSEHRQPQLVRVGLAVLGKALCGMGEGSRQRSDQQHEHSGCLALTTCAPLWGRLLRPALPWHPCNCQPRHLPTF